VADARATLNAPATVLDASLQPFVDQATEAVEFLCGPMSVQSFTETVQGCGKLVVSKTPTVALTSVTGEWMGALNVSLLAVSTTGVIRAVRGAQLILEDWYAVVYTAGRSTVPVSVKQGALIILKHQWGITQGATLRPGLGGDDSTMVPGLGYAIPNRALQALDPYLVGPSVG